VRVINQLLKHFPKSYSEELGIDLKSGKEGEIFKWFLASILFGARIGENIVKRTYKEFEKEGLITPKEILDAGWDRLVEVLDSGGYVRYDFRTASFLLEIMEKLLREYGSLEVLRSRAKNEKELVQLLGEFKKVGPTTINIFLRELRNVWKVNPPLSRFTILAARNLGMVSSSQPSMALKELQSMWRKWRVKGKTFIHLETALLRLGKNFCHKGRCASCHFTEFCGVQRV